MAEKHNNQPLTLWVSQTLGFLITNGLLLVSYTIIRVAHPIRPKLLPIGYLILGLGLSIIWAIMGSFSAKMAEEATASLKNIRTILCYVIPILAAVIWLVALIVYLAV